MSIAINPDDITSVFALGQWHNVVFKSFVIDAYELVCAIPPYRYEDSVHLAQFYPDEKQAQMGARWQVEPGIEMALPLFEIKAYKFQKHRWRNRTEFEADLA